MSVATSGDGDGDGDDETTEGSLLGPITTETDWGLTSVDVSITTGLTNPLPISIAVTSFSFEIFHDDGDDELLATGPRKTAFFLHFSWTDFRFMLL